MNLYNEMSGLFSTDDQLLVGEIVSMTTVGYMVEIPGIGLVEVDGEGYKVGSKVMVKGASIIRNAPNLEQISIVLD